MAAGTGDLETPGTATVGNDVIFWLGLLERGEVDRNAAGSQAVPHYVSSAFVKGSNLQGWCEKVRPLRDAKVSVSHESGLHNGVSSKKGMRHQVAVFTVRAQSTGGCL